MVTEAQALSRPRPPDLVIRPSGGWRAVDLREVWRSRDLLKRLGIRDLKVRYRQTVLGAAWVVFQPLLGAGIFSFVFGEVADLSSEGVPYFVFSFAGLLGWHVFSSTVTSASNSLVRDSALVSKIYFPRLILPLSVTSGVLVNFCVAMSLMVAQWVIYDGTAPGLSVLTLPLWVLLMLTLAMGIGLVAAALMVSYRDVGHILPVLVNFALYASPVAYSFEEVPERFRGVFSINPLVGAIDGFRWALVRGNELSAGRTIISVAVALVFLVVGLYSFARMERKFADVV